MLKSNSKEI